MLDREYGVRLSAAFAFVLAAISLVACGGDDQPQTTQTIQVTVPPATTPEVSSTTLTTEDPPAADDSAPQPGSGEGASDAIAAATAVLTDQGTAEEACGSYVTENFIQTSFGGEENCIAAREGQPLASAIKVEEGDQSSTHLVVVPAGGPYADARVEVDLVEEDGQFRVDALKAHVPAGP